VSDHKRNGVSDQKQQQGSELGTCLDAGEQKREMKKG
jgi:hypothetical protein